MSTHTHNIDLIIIGSGPAGISTALHLIKLDPAWRNRLLIIEKEVHPREKLCGGGITRLGLRTLLDLDIEFPLPLNTAAVEDITFRYHTRDVHVKGKPMFIVVHRPEFDHFLVQLARQRGIRINEGEAVHRVQRDDGGVLIETNKARYRCKILVGADGSRGVVRRLFRPHTKSKSARVLEVTHPASSSYFTFAKHAAVFDFSYTKDAVQGYTWDFPSYQNGQPTHNIGIYDSRYVATSTKAQLPTLLKKWVTKLFKSPPRYLLQGHPIHTFHPLAKWSFPNILLVGDALGADPLFGEGIAPALASGKPATMTIHQAFQRQDFALKHYKRVFMLSSVGRYLALRWFIAAISYRLCQSSIFMQLILTAGGILASIWQPGIINGLEQYNSQERNHDKKSTDFINQ